MNHLAQGKITAYSAGSQPVGEVHPLSLKYLEEKAISIEGLKSQSWNEFESIEPDVVITVCDRAAHEACPVWFGDCIQVHWGLPDPSKLEGSKEEIKRAFFSVMNAIENRTKKVLALDLERLAGEELRSALITISEEK